MVSPRKRPQSPAAASEANGAPVVKKRKKARFSELVHVSHDEDEISSSDEDDDDAATRSTHRAGSTTGTDLLGHSSRYYGHTAATPTSSAFEAMFPLDLTHFGSMTDAQNVAPSQHSIELEQRLGSFIDAHTVVVDSNNTDALTVLRAFMLEAKDHMYQLSLRLDAMENNVRAGSQLVRVRSRDTMSNHNNANHDADDREPSEEDEESDEGAQADDNRSMAGSVSVSEKNGLGVYRDSATPVMPAPATPVLPPGVEEAAAEAFRAIMSYKQQNHGMSPAPPSNGKVHHHANHSASPVAALPPLPSRRGARTANRNAAKKDSPSIEDDFDEQFDVDGTEGSKGRKGGKKHKARKPELSKVVRLKMLEMMGLYTSPPDIGTSKSASAAKTKAHGMLGAAQLPDFTPNELVDPLTGRRLWRWDYDKTIRQSQFNTKFSQEICNALTREHEQGRHDEVPIEHWSELADAVETAYANIRRERFAQLDPARREKKEAHVKRGKKRQMKVEKSRRRLKALADCHVDELDLTLSAATSSTTTTTDDKFPWMGAIIEARQNGYDVQAALDLAYMSSEEELSDTEAGASSSDVGTPTPDTVPSSSAITAPASAKKCFSLHKPDWRSSLYTRVLEQLDRVKPPERAFKRVIGSARTGIAPPPKTPAWMITDSHLS